MNTRNDNRTTTPRFAGRKDGMTEASAWQTFLVDLERRGLVQSRPPHVRGSSRVSDDPADGSRPADIENAVRKLIAVLREPSR